MVLRVAREDVPLEQSEEYFLQGGNDVDLDLYQRLVGVSDIDDVLDGLRSTHFGKVLDDAAVHYLETTTISTFQRALEDYLTRKIIAVGGTDPLGVGIAIAYLWSKQNEVTNLRIIAKGAEIGIPPERVERELILV
jgi:V/A-type H+-transporting ATPase subunit C